MKLKLIESTFFLLSIAVLAANGSDYKFVPDNSDVFSTCSDRDDAHDMSGMFDNSNLTLVHVGEVIHCEGSMKLVWNLEPTDRIIGYGGIFKYKRGAWQPTIYNMRREDACKVLYAKNEFWFDYWLKYVPEENRKCFNVKGAVLPLRPFDGKLRFENVPGPDMSGHYKITINMEAYDVNNQRRPDLICFDIVGDLVRM